MATEEIIVRFVRAGGDRQDRRLASDARRALGASRGGCGRRRGFTGLVTSRLRSSGARRCGRHRIERILRNLLDNAIEHSDRKGVDVVVGTPGRVMDMHARGMLPYDRIKLAILDEVDRMLDIGFREDIRKILGGMRNHPQTVFVSATISDEIEKLARSYMRNPEKIVTVAKSLTVQQVAQSYLSVEPWDKRRLLLHLLRREEPGLTVVFCRTKKAVDDVTLFLNDKGIDALIGMMKKLDEFDPKTGAWLKTPPTASAK
jgi:superfamily II DNA helicase RecQ